MLETKAYAAFDAKSPLGPYSFARREPRESDVAIEILYCGVCHSDLHQVRNDWKGSTFPMVPGHEIVGRVTRVGRKVTRFALGDIVGVGCLVDSCRACTSCKSGLEQYCESGPIFTYNGLERDGKTVTQGGYSTQIVTDQDFVVRVRSELGLERVAPLLCAGITTYSPLRHFGVTQGSRVAVAGLGGLGHMAVKLAAAMGAEVTLLSSSPRKRDDAKRLGAHEYVVTRDDAAVAKVRGRFDLLINTIAAPHDLAQLLDLVRLDGTMVLLGLPDRPTELPTVPLLFRRRKIAGSLIGGIAETQEMLDFCAERGIGADVEVIPVQEINNAFERMQHGDVRYRFVIDTQSLK